VDPSHIVLNGSSLGGELVVRAAAYEHRLAALVADPGFLGVWRSWQTKFAAITSLFTRGLSKQQINGAWQQKIVPMLVTAYDGDELVVPASGQGTEVHQLLRGTKQFHQFTAAQGADQHCGPMAPHTRNQVVYDLLDSIL
jgi:dienelactone hydrolase